MGFVLLTIYLRADLAEVSRVLQTIVLQPIDVERFSANLAPVDVRRVSGLDSVRGPVMQIAVVGTAMGEGGVERVTKALNRLIAVYKVVVVVS